MKAGTFRWAAFLSMMAILTFRACYFLFDTHRAIFYPFELDYGEGIVWQQAVMMLHGQAYGDINQYPFIVFHYPPVYHFLALATAGLTGLNQLVAGRLLSVFATVMAALMAGMIAGRIVASRNDKVRFVPLYVVATAMIVLSFTPVHLWAPLMRVDMVALFFTLGGFLCGMIAAERPKAIHLAALCFTLAVFSRQTMLAAPMACFAILWFSHRRTALMGIASGLGFSVTALILFSATAKASFLDHIVSYNVNRFEAERLWYVLRLFGTYPFYLTAALCAAAGMIVLVGKARRQISEPDPEDNNKNEFVINGMMVLYFILTSCSLLLYGKSGSNVNYMVEWCCVMAVLLGTLLPSALSVRPLTSGSVQTIAGLSRFAFLVPIAIVIQNLTAPWPTYASNVTQGPGFESRYQLVEQVRRAQKPVLSDDMVLLMQAGKQVPWEAAIFAELMSQGRWNPLLIKKPIERGDFAFLVTFTPYYEDRYREPLSSAIARAYPRKRRFGNYVIHYPE